MEYYGIDVSSYQKKPDWKEVAADHTEFAILRVHQRTGIDSSFEYNYKGCREQGIFVGVYKYSYALSPEEAVKEAEAVLSVLKGRKLEFPVFYDLEWEAQKRLGSRAVEEIGLAFLEKVQAAGYRVGIYSNVYWYDTVLTDRLKSYDCWLAAYAYEDNGKMKERLRPKAGVGWQYTSKGSVRGIEGYVDKNVFYKDYREGEEMKKAPAGQKVVELALSRLQKNQYTQSSKRVEVFNGYSDCSSLVWKCYERAYGMYVGSWTGEQVQKGRRLFLCANRGPYGRLTREELAKMQAGDCIFYGSGTACHVEIYMGDGRQIGHGSGMGPVIKDSLSYSHSCGVYQVRRYLPDDAKKPEENLPSTWKATGTAVSTGDNVNVRKSPGGQILRTVNKGNRFEVDGYVTNGWVHVRVEQVVGYIYETYVKADRISPEPEKNRMFVGKVTASLLNVRRWYGRQQNGEYYEKIVSYPELARDNLVDVLTAYRYGKEVWYKIRIAGKYIGFVDGSFIERV